MSRVVLNYTTHILHDELTGEAFDIQEYTDESTLEVYLNSVKLDTEDYKVWKDTKQLVIDVAYTKRYDGTEELPLQIIITTEENSGEEENNGEADIYFPSDYSLFADIPRDLKKMAQSTKNYIANFVKNIKMNYNELQNKPTRLSEFENDEGYLKEHQSLKDYAKKEETGNKLELDIDENTYVMTLKLLDIDNNELSSKEIDLPLETMVVGANYDNETKKIVLMLKNGNDVSFSVADLVSGLVSEVTFTNELAKKVDKVKGKDLSSNDFTNEDKAKLEDIEEGAQKNTEGTVIDANYVHTDNNFTDELKERLENGGSSEYDDTKLREQIEDLKERNTVLESQIPSRTS